MMDTIEATRPTTEPWPRSTAFRECLYDAEATYEYAQATGHLAEWNATVDCVFATDDFDQQTACW